MNINSRSVRHSSTLVSSLGPHVQSDSLHSTM